MLLFCRRLDENALARWWRRGMARGGACLPEGVRRQTVVRLCARRFGALCRSGGDAARQAARRSPRYRGAAVAATLAARQHCSAPHSAACRAAWRRREPLNRQILILSR